MSLRKGLGNLLERLRIALLFGIYPASLHPIDVLQAEASGFLERR